MIIQCLAILYYWNGARNSLHCRDQPILIFTLIHHSYQVDCYDLESVEFHFDTIAALKMKLSVDDHKEVMLTVSYWMKMRLLWFTLLRNHYQSATTLIGRKLDCLTATLGMLHSKKYLLHLLKKFVPWVILCGLLMNGACEFC